MFKAIGLLEFNSIAQGVNAADVMLKAGEVELVTAMTVCPGKYVALVGGDVAAVENAVKQGIQSDEGSVVESLVIPNVHPNVFPAITCTSKVDHIAALGVIETFSIANCIVVADAAVKAAEVILMELRMGMGIGGKAFVSMTGEVAEVEHAVKIGTEIAVEKGWLTKSVVIPSPHQLLREKML